MNDVMVGDKVYDLLLGGGTVSSVEPDRSFTAEFSGGVSKRYSAGGFIGKQRRVYWSNPIIIEPPKSQTVWVNFVSAAKLLFSVFNVPGAHK